MIPEQIVQWRRREERAIYTGQYDESSDQASDSEEEGDETSSERIVPPGAGNTAEARVAPPAEGNTAEERVVPPAAGNTAGERVAPPAAGSTASVRADPLGPEPESESAVQRISGQDPFAHMTPEEMARWLRAEDRFLGL